MRLLQNRLGRSVVAGVLGASVLVGGAHAAGLIAGPDGVIHGCYQNTNGKLRVVAVDQTCERNETALPWNQKGPAGAQGVKGDTGLQGPKGDAGDTGPQGPRGDAGPAGGPALAEYESVPVQQAITGAGGWVFDAACPGGKTAISGGYTLPSGANVMESHPRDGDPGVWRLAFSVPGPTTIKLYLQCARTA